MDKFGFAMLLIVLFGAMPTASAQNVTLYFDPQHSNTPSYGDNTTVEIYINIPSGMTVSYGQFGFRYGPTCGDIIARNLYTDMPNGNDPGWASWNSPPTCYNDTYDWIVFSFWLPQNGPTQTLIGNFTIQGNNYCTNDIDFACKPGCLQGSYIDIRDSSDNPVAWNVSNGTFTCGKPQTFSKPLYEGWNLISLPLDPAKDDRAGAVLSGVFYDAVYRYDATLKQFEGIESTDAMNPGTGYFVHVTADCMLNYSGYACTSMDVSLEHGLNMVGWLNCSKDVGAALSSISGDCYYIARWNPTAEKFEVHNPAAPSTFNDFATMGRGTGYFISAKQGCALSENC